MTYESNGNTINNINNTNNHTKYCNSNSTNECIIMNTSFQVNYNMLICYTSIAIVVEHHELCGAWCLRAFIIIRVLITTLLLLLLLLLIIIMTIITTPCQYQYKHYVLSVFDSSAEGSAEPSTERGLGVPRIGIGRIEIRRGSRQLWHIHIPPTKTIHTSDNYNTNNNSSNQLVSLQ